MTYTVTVLGKNLQNRLKRWAGELFYGSIACMRANNVGAMFLCKRSVCRWKPKIINIYGGEYFRELVFKYNIHNQAH